MSLYSKLTFARVPDKLSADEHFDGESHHVPVGLALVFHHVQGGGHVAVAVVAEEVVDPAAVDVGRFRDPVVPAGGTSCRQRRVQAPIS